MSESGNAEVDAVLLSLDTLGDRPVEEHVALFESAHTALRAALDSRDDQVAASPSSI